MYVCMYVCMYVYMHIYIDLFIYLYIHVYTYKYLCIYRVKKSKMDPRVKWNTPLKIFGICKSERIVYFS